MSEKYITEETGRPDWWNEEVGSFGFANLDGPHLQVLRVGCDWWRAWNATHRHPLYAHEIAYVRQNPADLEGVDFPHVPTNFDLLNKGRVKLCVEVWENNIHTPRHRIIIKPHRFASLHLMRSEKDLLDGADFLRITFSPYRPYPPVPRVDILKD